MIETVILSFAIINTIILINSIIESIINSIVNRKQFKQGFILFQAIVMTFFWCAFYYLTHN